MNVVCPNISRQEDTEAWRPCDVPGCLLRDFHIGPHSTDEARRKRTMRCWIDTTTPEADRNELQQHTASSAVVIGGAAGVYDQGGDEEQHNEEMVLVDAEQVDDDELLNACVWWPSPQKWRIGDVIAYRQGLTEQSLQQHFIPHDGYLVKYLTRPRAI